MTEKRQNVIDAAKRICRERCAIVGEPVCYGFFELAFPNPECERDGDGCHTLACLALNEPLTNTTHAKE